MRSGHLLSVDHHSRWHFPCNFVWASQRGFTIFLSSPFPDVCSSIRPTEFVISFPNVSMQPLTQLKIFRSSHVLSFSSELPPQSYLFSHWLFSRHFLTRCPTAKPLSFHVYVISPVLVDPCLVSLSSKMHVLLHGHLQPLLSYIHRSSPDDCSFLGEFPHGDFSSRFSCMFLNISIASLLGSLCLHYVHVLGYPPPIPRYWSMTMIVKQDRVTCWDFIGNNAVFLPYPVLLVDHISYSFCTQVSVLSSRRYGCYSFQYLFFWL